MGSVVESVLLVAALKVVLKSVLRSLVECEASLSLLLLLLLGLLGRLWRFGLLVLCLLCFLLHFERSRVDLKSFLVPRAEARVSLGVGHGLLPLLVVSGLRELGEPAEADLREGIHLLGNRVLTGGHWSASHHLAVVVRLHDLGCWDAKRCHRQRLAVSCRERGRGSVGLRHVARHHRPASVSHLRCGIARHGLVERRTLSTSHVAVGIARILRAVLEHGSQQGLQRSGDLHLLFPLVLGVLRRRLRKSEMSLRGTLRGCSRLLGSSSGALRLLGWSLRSRVLLGSRLGRRWLVLGFALVLHLRRGLLHWLLRR